MGAIKLATSPTTDEEYGGTIEKKYSTTEQVVGTWIDGKPIYQKTVEVGALSDYTKDAFVADNIDLVISMSGVAIRNDRVAITIPRAYPVDQASNSAIDLSYRGNGYIRIYNAQDYSAFSRTYIHVQYTKTTD